jgi:hypothetical protein
MEAFLKGERVAAHARSYLPGLPTTVKEHMPPAHQKYLEWTPSRIIQWAAKTGAATAQVVEQIMSTRTYPEQGYRSCLGILRLGQHYEAKRVEAAACRALKFRACSFKSMRAILKAGLDQQAEAPGMSNQIQLPLHENVRGGEYYVQE